MIEERRQMITREEVIGKLEEIEAKLSELRKAIEQGWDEASPAERTKAFLDKCGGWEDDRTPEEIIADIYSSRTVSDRAAGIFDEGGGSNEREFEDEDEDDDEDDKTRKQPRTRRARGPRPPPPGRKGRAVGKAAAPGSCCSRPRPRRRPRPRLFPAPGTLGCGGCTATRRSACGLIYESVRLVV